MNKWGLHLANDDGKNPEAEIEQIVATGVSHFTLLDFQADNARRLREASPDGTILVRFYLPKWRDRNPVDWARECAERYLRVRDGSWSLKGIHAAVTPANEQNLAVEGGDTSRECFEETAVWNGAWLTEFTRLTGIAQSLTHWPAWAFGNYDDWDPKEAPRGYTGIGICKEVIKRYGVFDGHPYWHTPDPTPEHPEWGIENRWDGGRDQIWTDALPDMPIFCSELCAPDVMAADAAEYIARWFKYAETRPNIIGGTVFIVRDPHHSMMNNDLSRNPAIIQRIAEEVKARNVIPTPPTGKLWLAVLPSNQDRNPVLGGGNEMTQLATFAGTLASECAAYAPITVRVFTGKPESTDAVPLANLRAQVDAATAWLATAPKGTYTVALNLHTDSGPTSHVGWYYVGGQDTVSYRLGRRAAQAIAPLFGNAPIWSGDYSTYIFARSKVAAAPVLLELGSHEVSGDVAALKTKASAIARGIVEAVLTELSLPTTRRSTLNVAELRTFPTWATERLANGEDFRGVAGLAAFKAHLAGIGADAQNERRYGWPT